MVKDTVHQQGRKELLGWLYTVAIEIGKCELLFTKKIEIKNCTE